MIPICSYSLIKADKDVVAISAALFTINTITRASRWNLEQFKEVLSKPNYRVFCAFLESDRSTPIAYSIYSFLDIESHLVNVAVAPAYQRMGIGFQLVKFSLKHLSDEGSREVWLEVRESNLIARECYKKADFVETQIRKDFYEQPKENAVLMLARI